MNKLASNEDILFFGFFGTIVTGIFFIVTLLQFFDEDNVFGRDKLTGYQEKCFRAESDGRVCVVKIKGLPESEDEKVNLSGVRFELISDEGKIENVNYVQFKKIENEDKRMKNIQKD
ncbi:hypothetical protein [Thermoactinomyces sp. DSM 45892]|uniref:hypothetical protein n=1 Tax=Thermoactinomyces sp. DSM 45892 TaxID=1882753 RepID=UPI000899E6A6|nr:hypothetical protein [Thermoactinomyces sp. DSM 45892]SDY88351.1 hypothetical protein SAMN05444416_109163 [Thermoactinomyces sp. DSM 45892]